MKKYICTAFALGLSVLFYSQKSSEPHVWWEQLLGSNIFSESTQYIKARKYKKLAINESYLKDKLGKIENELKRNIPDTEKEKRFLKLLNAVAEIFFEKLDSLPVKAN